MGEAFSRKTLWEGIKCISSKAAEISRSRVSGLCDEHSGAEVNVPPLNPLIQVILKYNQVISHYKSEKKKKNQQSFPLITIEVKQGKKPGRSNCSSEATRIKYKIISKTKHSSPLLPNPFCCQCAGWFLQSQSKLVGQNHDPASLRQPCTPRCPGLFSQIHSQGNTPQTWERSSQHALPQHPTSLETQEASSFTGSTICVKINT